MRGTVLFILAAGGLTGSIAAGPDLRAARPQHPRLYLDAGRIAALRQEVTTTRSHVWGPVRAWTDERLRDPPIGDLRGDLRRVGEILPYAALCHLVTRDGAYLDLAARIMRVVVQEPHWGDDRDIEAAHLLYGLAVAYDWLYPELTPAGRAAVEAKLALHGALMRRLAAGRHPPLNNHRIVNLCALGVAALALGPEAQETGEWLEFVNGRLADTMAWFGTDGYWGEGVSYWSYTVEYLLKYAAAADPLLGTSFLDHPWLRNAARMPLALALPPGAWQRHNMFVNLEDSPRFCWYGPHAQLYKLAALTGDGEAQWLADRIVESGLSQEHADWLSVLWYDPRVAPRPPAPGPRRMFFDDWDVAVLRGGADPARETVCVFQCSPAGGRLAAAGSPGPYPGSGHQQPDANNFVLFSRGEWLVADTGATLVKRTSDHNTVVVNGAGQRGEGGRWFDGRRQAAGRCAGFAVAGGGPGFDYVIGDASAIYRSPARLTRYLRHLIYIRPDMVVIVDELGSRRAARFEWLLHTPGAVCVAGPGRAVIRSGDAVLQVAVVEPADGLLSARVKAIDQQYPGRDWERLNLLTLRPAGPARDAVFIVVLQAASAPAVPLDVRALEEDGAMVLRVASGADPVEIRLRGAGFPRAGPGILESIACPARGAAGGGTRGPGAAEGASDGSDLSDESDRSD